MRQLDPFSVARNIGAQDVPVNQLAQRDIQFAKLDRVAQHPCAHPAARQQLVFNEIAQQPLFDIAEQRGLRHLIGVIVTQR